MKNVSVNLKGRIVSISHLNDSDALVLVTGEGIVDFPRVIFSGDTRKRLEGFKKGDQVDVTGTIDMYPVNHSSESASPSFHQRITGLTIKPSTSETMKYFGIDFGTYTTENRIFTSGKMHIVRETDRRIDIDIQPNDSNDVIRMSCYRPSSIALINKIEDGTEVCVLGEVHTHLLKATESSRRRVFETFVVSNICKC